MYIKMLNKKNKLNKVDQSKISLPSSISIWKILASFVVLNLIIVNIFNFWQPFSFNSSFNNQELKQKYQQRQTAELTAYDLQGYFNNFKNNPDSNAFVLIQKSVKLNNEIEQLQLKELAASANKLNKSIEEIVATIPSLKSFLAQIDKIIRINQNLKEKNLAIIDNIQDNLQYNLQSSVVMKKSISNNMLKNINISKNLLITEDKVDELLQNLKYNYWLPTSVVAKHQNNIEEIRLEIEQINKYIEDLNNNTQSKSSNIQSISANLDELFNQFNFLMPVFIEMSEASNKLNTAEQYLTNIINELKAIKNTEVELNTISDITIVNLTLVFACLLLFSLILIAKAGEKTKNYYHDYTQKKEIYYLSHNTTNTDNKISSVAADALVTPEVNASATMAQPECVD